MSDEKKFNCPACGKVIERVDAYSVVSEKGWISRETWGTDNREGWEVRDYDDTETVDSQGLYCPECYEDIQVMFHSDIDLTKEDWARIRKGCADVIEVVMGNGWKRRYKGAHVTCIAQSLTDGELKAKLTVSLNPGSMRKYESTEYVYFDFATMQPTNQEHLNRKDV